MNSQQRNIKASFWKIYLHKFKRKESQVYKPYSDVEELQNAKIFFKENIQWLYTKEKQLSNSHFIFVVCGSKVTLQTVYKYGLYAIPL